MSLHDESPAPQGGDGEPQAEFEIPGMDVPVFANAAAILTPQEDARRKDLCDAAVGYAGHGWRIVPVHWIDDSGNCSCPRGEECPSPAKHPVHDGWQNVATCDQVDVATWWRPENRGQTMTEWFPLANIGIVTGRKSGIFVLDEDTYNGGDQTLANYVRRHGEMPETRIHDTGSAGKHYFFIAPPDFDVRNSAGKTLGRGLDVRGENGFVVAPPSMSAKGFYELNPVHDIAPSAAPDWLLERLRHYDQGQNGSMGAGQFVTESTGSALKYVEAALRAESDRMRNAAEGVRNDTLNQCAFSLGTLGGAGLLSEEAAFSALREAALAAGLGEHEIRATFLSGWTSGLEKPRSVQWQSMGAVWPMRARTEFGNCDRMGDHFGRVLRFCPERNCWMIYEGGVWRQGTRDEGMWYAQMMIRSLPETEALSYDTEKIASEDGSEPPTSPREDFIQWTFTQQKASACRNAAELAKGAPLMRMSQDTFDSDPLLLNARNGVVNLATGDLLKHDPEQRMTLQAAAPFLGPDTPAPQWEAFLRRVQPSADMRGYLQRVAGYCATGLTIEQVFFLMHGAGANGKSVCQGVLSAILGSYAQTMPVDTLMASSIDSRIPNDVARMAGRRFLVAAESKQGKSLDEARMRALTGGDTIAARYMRAEYFEFRPVGKLQLTTNHLPRLSDDKATWRRIHVIPWPVQIPEEERDGFLQERLIREEAAGILAWIIRGAIAWNQDGLRRPREVDDAVAAYQRDEDTVAQFVEECIIVHENRVPRGIGRSANEIYAAYERWCAYEHIKTPMSPKALSQRLKKMFPHPEDHFRTNGWTGFPRLQTRETWELGGGAA